MSEIYYFGSEKVAPSTAVMDFNDGILKRVLLGNESEEKEPVSPEQEKTNKFIEETGKKLHLDLNGTPLKSPKEEGQVNITPEKVEINFTSVKCGLRYAIFQDDYGKLYSCGYGNLGELGLGKDKTYTKVPTLIDGLEYKRVAKYSCGPNHVVACSSDNKIFSWGDGNYGKQGVSAPTAIFRPLILSFSKVNTTSLKIQEDGTPVKERHRKEAPSVDYRWVDVACGGDFSIFAAEQGAFALGRETNGRLGVGAIFEPTSIPLNISFFQKIKIMGIASGKGHSAAWDSEGYAYSWGDGSEGRLGHSIDKGFHMSKFEIVPKRIIALEKYRILLMSCGNSHTCALTNKGEILTWGKASSNNKGEKSNYKLLEYFSPRKLTVNSSGDSKTPEPVFIKVVCGPTHNAAIDKDFKLYTWGDSSENCLGYPSDEDVLFPSLVKRLGDTKIIDVGCGDNFTFVIGCNQHKNLPSKALRSFQEGYLEHMKNTIQNIQEWRKRKAQSEFKLSTIQTPKPNITLPTHPDSPHTSVHEGGAKNTNFAATSNSSFFRSLSPSNLQLLDKVTTPKKFTRTAGSSSKLPFIMEASQKVAGIIDASSKNPRSPTLPHLARQHNHSTQHNMLSEALMSEPAKSPTSPAINSPKFKLAIPDEIKKSPDNATFKNLDSVRSAFLPILFSPADENVRAQATEPDDYESLFGKKAVVDDYDVYSEVNENKIKDMMAKQAEQKVQANNTKVAKALYDEIDTHDDQLKFEYIQMVKSGKEQEHMLYLLTDPEGSNAYSETSLKHEKMKMKHQQEIQQDHLRTRHLIDSVKKTKESLVERALPMTSDLIHQITGVYKYTKNFLEERVEARKLVPDDANRQPVVVVTNEDIVKRAVENRQRTMKVLHKKKEIEVARKQYLQEKFNKRTDEYKEALRLEKIEKVRKAECVKEMSSYFMFETMLNLIRVAAERGLQIKRQLFRYSMKARLIQSTYKKHAIIKKLKRLTPEQKANLVRMVRNYLMNKKVRKIVLLHLRLKLEFKIRTNLLLFKTKMANIFTFLQWTHKKMEAYRYKLALEWDNQIINNFKLKADAPISTDSPLVIIKYKSAESLNLKSGDSSPSREIQTNQIEEFISRSNRNFIKFLTLQNEGALKAPITLHPSILPTTYELNVGIKFEADNSNNTKPTKKSKNDDKKVVKEAERVEQKIKTFNNMLLPFSYHYCKALSIQYRINHETSSPFKDFIFERSVEFEAHLKYDFMNRILKECLRKYDEELKEYRKKLIKFKSDSNAEINLYRTMKMLNTPVDRLKALQKKEEYQMKRRTESISGNKAGNRFRNTEPENYQRDHLPFGTMLLKIAAVMPKAPKRPSLVVALKPNEFNVYFSKYYEAFKQKYTQMVMEEREKLFKRKV